MLWEIDIFPGPAEPDRAARQVALQAAELGLASHLEAATAHGYLVEGNLDQAAIHRIATELLTDTVVERFRALPAGDPHLAECPARLARLVYVLPKPGVMDPVAQSALGAIADLGFSASGVRTLRKYWFGDLDGAALQTIATKVLANDAIEQVVIGPLPFRTLDLGGNYQFQIVRVPIRELDAAGLQRLSREGQLYLSLTEMQTIQSHFRELGRDPTDVELESLAQTWSEHCSHKTLAGRIAYRGPDGQRQFQNMLKETIFAATVQVRQRLGRRRLVRERVQRQRRHRAFR